MAEVIRLCRVVVPAEGSLGLLLLGGSAGRLGLSLALLLLLLLLAILLAVVVVGSAVVLISGVV